MFCMYCGKENPPHSKHCGFCGKLIAMPVEQPVTAHEAPVFPADESATTQKTKKMSKGLVAALIVVGVAVLGLLAWLVWILRPVTVWVKTEQYFESEDYEYEYTYDKEGKLIKTVRLEDDEEEYWSIYRYKDDRVIKVEEHYADGESFYCKCFYDKQGNLTKIQWYDEDDEMYFHIINTYDDDGNRTKRSYYNKDGEETQSETYTYDEKGNLTETTTTTTTGYSRRDVYKYDDESRCVERKSYAGDKVYLVYNYTYDDNGNCVEEEVADKDGNLQNNTIYEYDKHGNCVETKVYDADGKQTNHTVSEWEKRILTHRKAKELYESEDGKNTDIYRFDDDFVESMKK